MAFTITSKNGEKTFADKELVNISSIDGYDYKLDVNFKFMLAIQYDSKNNTCVLLNQFNSQKFLFKGKPIPARLEINKVCKIMVDGSDEFLTIKVLGVSSEKNIKEEDITEDDVKAIYGDSVNAGAKLKIEKRKSEIEEARVAIIKEVASDINNLNNRISMNSKSGILMHIALFLASLVLAFGLSNYLTGLPLSDAGSVIQMPTNMKLIFVYTFIVYGIGLVLKQGVFLFLQNKLGEDTITNRIAEKFMIITASIFYASIYIVNVLYYIQPKSFPIFAVLISLFFVGTATTLAIACGYFKSSSVEMKKELNIYEYRPDFEKVIKEYQQWIERWANNLSNTKIRNIKDKLFMLQLESLGEMALGILTAPFLAYGVSNTLALCFPEAAGWIRISGLRFSPIFLVLATFLIIFAFFNFVNGLVAKKKIQASNVLKHDGFSNYIQHGVEIYGLEGIQKNETDARWAFTIGITIMIIEFSMNVSYFMQENTSDLRGIVLSAFSALVPTAILLAETYLLSHTNFKIFACSELVDKIDKD